MGGFFSGSPFIQWISTGFGGPCHLQTVFLGSENSPRRHFKAKRPHTTSEVDNLIVTIVVMASNLRAMASNLLAMASTGRSFLLLVAGTSSGGSGLAKKGTRVVSPGRTMCLPSGSSPWGGDG